MKHGAYIRTLLFAVLCLVAAPAMASTEDVINGRLSANWSGYVASRSAQYTAVGASWVVPTLRATTTLMTDVAWVGIGGSKSKDLIQAGTHSAVQNGKTYYWAWYELLPDYQKKIALVVAGGDKVNVSLVEVAENMWYLSFINEMTGAFYGETFEYRSRNSSAEWIQEMPVVYDKEGERTYAPLSEFGTVTFSDAYAVVDGEHMSIGDTRASAVTMVSRLNKKVVLSVPSEVEDDGFVVVRTKAVPSPTEAKAGKRNRSQPWEIVWSKQ